MLLLLAGCGARSADQYGNAAIGAVAIARQACGSCHVIPGVEESNGMTGPSLAHFARQQTIAGTLPNDPANLVRYLRAPQEIVKGNAMPDAGLSEQQARDIAAYLYTLR